MRHPRSFFGLDSPVPVTLHLSLSLNLPSLYLRALGCTEAVSRESEGKSQFSSLHDSHMATISPRAAKGNTKKGTAGDTTLLFSKDGGWNERNENIKGLENIKGKTPKQDSSGKNIVQKKSEGLAEDRKKKVNPINDMENEDKKVMEQNQTFHGCSLAFTVPPADKMEVNTLHNTCDYSLSNVVSLTGCC